MTTATDKQAPAWDRFRTMSEEVHDMLIGAAQCRNHVLNGGGKWSGRIAQDGREFGRGDRTIIGENFAVIIGAGTVRHDGHPMLLRYPDLVAKRKKRGAAAHPVNVVLSGDLDLPLRRFFAGDATQRIIFTTRRASAARIRKFQRVAEVVVLPGKHPAAEKVVEELRKRGLRKLILEGGGEVHFPFAKAGLVDEWYITITPRLIGGKNAPSFLDGEGFLKKDHIQLRLVSLRRVKDELFLRYKKK